MSIVVGFLFLFVPLALGEGPHCTQGGHGPSDMIMSSGRINPKYTWYKRGHKTYVPVVLDPTYSHSEQDIIIGGLNEIKKKTCVEFDFYDDYDNDVKDRDHVYITRRTKRGCFSYIGRIGRGRQEIGLPPGCITHRTAMHEMMHALGFRHEHVRHDRDDYIIIFWGNIRQGRETNFQKRSSDNAVGPYDYDSIMHYDRRAFSKNKMDTIRPLKNGVQIGVRQTMSHWDAKKINIMYGCSAAGHLSWSPEHDHDLENFPDLDDILPALPRNASSSPPDSSEIEVAYDELDYDPSLDRSERGPQGRSGRYGYGPGSNEFLDGNHGNGHNGRGHGNYHEDEEEHRPHPGRRGYHDQPQNQYGHSHGPGPGPNQYHPPQSYSNFDLDSYPGNHVGGNDDASDDSVDFYD